MPEDNNAKTVMINIFFISFSFTNFTKKLLKATIDMALRGHYFLEFY